MREQAFDAGAVAQIVVEIDGSLALANERARQLFRLSPRDMGRVLQDLEVSYRPIELRSRIEQAYSERRAVEVKEVLWPGPSSVEALYMDVQVIPLFEGGVGSGSGASDSSSSGAVLGVSVTFADVTRTTRLQQQLKESNRELETAYEELQSTNEELQTLNEELQNRSSELNHVNAFLASILGSLSGGVIVIDREMTAQVWNQKSEDLWGLRADEVRNKNLMALDIGLPVEELKSVIRACLSGGSLHEEQTVEATNRRGRAFSCKVSCTPLISQNSETLGVILLVEEA